MCHNYSSSETVQPAIGTLDSNGTLDIWILGTELCALDQVETCLTSFTSQVEQFNGQEYWLMNITSLSKFVYGGTRASWHIVRTFSQGTILQYCGTLLWRYRSQSISELQAVLNLHLFITPLRVFFFQK